MKRKFVLLAAIMYFCGLHAQDFNSTSIFRSWGFIGDSLCSGEMECYAEGNPEVQYVDLYEYSWGQQLCRLSGSEGYNFSHGGQTARGWLDEWEGERGWGWASRHPKQAYILALGVNDYTRAMRGDSGFSLEEYAVDMAEIVRRIRSVSPDSYIFVLTRPREEAEGNAYDSWNDVLRNLPAQFTRLWVIDLYKNAPVYDASFRQQYYLNGHLSPAGYLYTAHLLMAEIDRIVRSEPSAFKEVALAGTPWKGSSW